MRQTRDPITGFRDRIVGAGLAEISELKAIEAQVTQYIMIASGKNPKLIVQFGGFFQNFWKIFQNKGKNNQIQVTEKLQSQGIIIKTEYVRFAKIGGFFKNFGRFFVKLIKKS